MNYRLFILLLVAFSISNCQQMPTNFDENISLSNLAEGFASPPDSVKPWVYWYWMNDNISKEGISRDLEAMARVGIGEALIGNQAVPNLPTGNVPILSEEWLELTLHAIKEGARTGVDIGLFNCPGWSQSGGPWITPDKAMRYLAITDTIVKGPMQLDATMMPPAADFQEVAVLAIPYNELDLSQYLKATLAQFDNVEHLFDNEEATAAIYPMELDSAIVEVTFNRPITLRSIIFKPTEQKGILQGKLLASVDGKMVAVRDFTIDRHNTRLTVGPQPYAPVAIAFPATTSQSFQLVFYQPEESYGLKEIQLSSAPKLEYFAEKQLAKMYQDNLPDWYAYQWRLQPEHDKDTLAIDLSGVINLSENLKGNQLQWQVPEGAWKILRLGMTPTGVTNHGAMPAAIGLEVDKMSTEALEHHWDSYVGRVIKGLEPRDKKAFRHIVADSYETGSQNWTNDLKSVFEETYGYNPMPWLPVLSGVVINTPAQSERFLWDLRRLVADRIATEYGGHLAKLTQENGLKLWLENYGHWGFPTEFLKYGKYADQVSGEFWSEGNLGSIECRAASSASNIYGKKVISAESYTSAGKHFQRHPGYLKKRGDWSFTEGINHVVLHLYIQQPWQDSIPGVNAWFGVEFNRHNTYFDQLSGWIDYQRRVMFMLQRGNPVKDVAYFIGEDAPVMTGLQQPELPDGYDFDYINADVIMNRLSVENGRLVLPEGISYSLMVLPPLKTMRPELLQKIESLVAQGAKILGAPPQYSPSLQNYPQADEEIRRLANAMWGDAQQKVIEYKQGIIFNDMNLNEAFDYLDRVPDFSIEEKENFLYTHREMGDIDIYFISNQTDEVKDVTAKFRVKDKYPQLWNPVSGEVRPLPQFTVEQNQVAVPLQFAPAQSWLLVFSPEKPRQVKNAENFPSLEKIMDLDGKWHVQFDPEMKGPVQPVILENLQDWSTHANDSIRYYSGTAIYRQNFNYQPQKAEKVVLDLGEVAVMADVYLNGKKVGNVWHTPYQLEVTPFLQPGENQLEIHVVNQWVNRLIGDSRMPQSERLTYLTSPPYGPDSKLLPAGMLGPVVMMKEK